MFQTVRNAFKVADLRKKILYTILIIIIFRLGSAITVPFLDPSVLKSIVTSDNSFLGYFNVLTGGGLEKATIFAMSITPYINASIIVQLLTVAIPYLERLQKEGEVGRKKLGKITRYLTFVLALIQAVGFFFLLKSNNAVEYSTGWEVWFTGIIIVAAFTAGSCLIVWLGERITQKGIGNGISVILFAGIISRAPQAFSTLKSMWELGGQGQWQNYIYVPLIVVIFIAMIIFIIVMTNAERRIPVMYAKRVVGRKMYGGQNSHIPVKVSMSGVMPIIFATSILSIPSLIAQFVNVQEGFWLHFFQVFRYDSWGYAILYFVLIIAFNFFYIAIQYNPIEIANNLRKNNGAIPGIRPGKPTSDFISRVIWKIAMLGAVFLGIIAVFPIFFQMATGAQIALGGTSIIIIVSVALDTMRALESQLTMRKHKGFLE
ncbi:MULTISPECIES: preprotein translocase subunit SecY [Clostridiaceae]|uniref:Protein translocase subunit SecY n=1 Tax=Clostridium facile TaxID=2763035 RepID=A0ABR7IS51_9CLOT|nr:MULTISPECIES: preprotein translocase subunit SecY [Clostridiaceae]MBC5787974.1 preprotein translocase subunit SecY [Clostridium facile]PWM99933.1 MAG: preprotein translocase subunit SecY [Massilioclostridium sp.]